MVLILAALFVRGGVVWLRSDDLRTDPDGYRAYAESLLAKGNFLRNGRPSAWRPPLYPLILAGCLASGLSAPVAIGALHLALGVATVGLATLVARCCLAGLWAIAAGALVACDPILLYQSTEPMTETLATFLAVATIWALCRFDERASTPRAAVAGFLVGLAALCRPTYLIWGAIVWPLVWHRARRTAGQASSGTRREDWWVSGAFGLALLLALCPWTVRNWVQLGRPIATTTHGGYTLLLGNNRYFYRYLHEAPWGAVWDSAEFVAWWRTQLRAQHIDNEVAEDRFAYRLSWQIIREAPGDFALASLVRLGRLWSPLPHARPGTESPTSRGLRYAVAGFYCVEFLLAALALGGWARRCLARAARGTKAGKAGPAEQFSKDVAPEVGSDGAVPSGASYLLAWGGTLLVALSLVQIVYWSDMRMRAPAMPIVALAAAAGAAGLAGRFVGPRHESSRA